MSPLPNTPPLAEREKPGLSETLDGRRHPAYCQSCSARHAPENPVSRWLEHDPWDRISEHPVVVVLCRACSKGLIDPHPRLYRELDAGHAFPGAMGICVGCVLRHGTACTSPKAKLNGGEGLQFTWKTPPRYVHLKVAKPGVSGFRYLFDGPVLTCSDRSERERTR